MAGSTRRILTDAERALLDEARTAVLATIAPDGRPRLVPVCYAIEGDHDVLWIPLDAKPKSVTDVRDLARVRDIVARPAVTLLVDRWSEDWTELAWLRLEGVAALVGPPSPAWIADALVARYPQYADHDLVGRPAIRVTITRATGWRGGG